MTLSYPELAQLCWGLALLLHSGISVSEGAFLLARQQKAAVGELLPRLGASLDQGKSLAEAMAETGAFPEPVRSMVYIGEETGRLEEALNSLADYYEERIRTARQIRNAVAYPALVMILMLLVVGVLLVKVLPVFDRVYGSLGSRLTGPAAGLLYTGRLLEAAMPVLCGILLLLAMAAGLLWFWPDLRNKLGLAWKRRYGDRGISRKFNNALFARALAMGLSSGLMLESCMALAENLLQDVPDAARRCSACAKAMEEGASLADALEQWDLLPPAQCTLLQLGSRSGNADRIMEQIADTLMEDAQNALQQRISSIEPAMVLVSSLLVGLILLSVMLPLADILAVLG